MGGGIDVQEQQSTIDLSNIDTFPEAHRTPQQARMWATEDFVPAHLQTALPFWRDHILQDTSEPERSTLLEWVQGVNLYDFADPHARGSFQGKPYNGAHLTPVQFPNHVPDEFTGWVTTEVTSLVESGCVARWEDVADTSRYPMPHMVLPLGVEPKKPRLIWDARWLNLMCVHNSFSMDGVGKVSQCSWRGAHQVTLDHKAGYHHVALNPDSWQYFGFEWQGVFYVFTVLAFGWCSAPFIYASLSEAVARYLRARGIPTLTWIDDFYLTNFRSTRMLSASQQFQAAQTAAFVALEVFYRAGYFVSVNKSHLDPTTSLVFLGITCDSAKARFEVPEDKLDKLEAILTEAISEGVISFKMLEKLAGKCTSLSVAVPVAALYTHHMYRQLARFQQSGGRRRSPDIDIPKNGGLMFELRQWLEVRRKFNGASWYGPARQRVKITGASDASSRAWAGLIESPGHTVFQAGGDFPPEFAQEHINLQEGYALQQTLHLFCEERPFQLAGSTLISDIDNKVFHDAFKRGRSSVTIIHDLITDLFWLQVEHDFTLRLRWVSSEDNAVADGMSRQGSDDFVRLEEQVFGELCAWAGDGITMDLMATPASTHNVWSNGCRMEDRLPFYSRYKTDGCAGVDVLSQNLRYMPGSEREPCFGFCFPPINMVGVVLQHLEECQARALMVVPGQKQSWFPRLAGATVRSRTVPSFQGGSPFFTVHHQKGMTRFSYRKWEMLAIVVDFANK